MRDFPCCAIACGGASVRANAWRSRPSKREECTPRRIVRAIIIAITVRGPEFAMKKLLAAGERRIFALSRVFRNRERGALHAPEFTVFEWYRAEAPIEALMAECAVTLRLAAERISAMGAKYASILRPQLPHAFEGHCDDDATTDKATLPEGVDA